MQRHDVLAAAVFQGLSFVVSFENRGLSFLESPGPLRRDVIESLGGTVLRSDICTIDGAAATVTHLVCQHQQQTICSDFPDAERVSFVWVYQCALSRRRISPDAYVLFRPFPDSAFPSSSTVEATVTGFCYRLRGGPGEGWSQRSLLFDIIRCSGMSGNRTLDPKTVTHLVVEDLDKPSEKLQAAHTSSSIAIVSARWLLACAETWQLADADGPQSYGALDLLDAAKAHACTAAQRASGGAMLAASASYSRSLLLQPQVPQTTRKLPELPAEVWRVVARATLAASDSSLSAWLRLSMVSRDWRQALKDSTLTLTAGAPLTPDQWQWLRTTAYNFRHVAFHPNDVASIQLLSDNAILGASEASLHHMDGVHLELDGSEYPDEGEGSLARFTALRSLTLRQKDFDGLLWDELHLPSGLRDLVPVGASGTHHLTPPELQLGPLMELTRLELKEHDDYFGPYDDDDDEYQDGDETRANVDLPPQLKLLRIEACNVSLSRPVNWLREHADPLPALEVVADRVLWDWRMRLAVNGARSIIAGFSHVSVRAARLFMECSWRGRGWGVPDAPSPEEALVGIVCHAPPTMRTCCLGAAAMVEGPAQSWDMEVTSVYERDAQPHELECNPYSPARRFHKTILYQSAAKLAERLLPPAAATNCITVRLDEQRQVVHLTRTDAA